MSKSSNFFYHNTKGLDILISSVESSFTYI